MTVQEISLVVANRPGALRDVAHLLAEGRINVAALSVASQGNRSFCRVVVNDTENALWRLRKAGYKVDATDLLIVHMEDKAGALVRVLDVLAAKKINVLAACILVTRAHQRVLIGLAVTNPQRARTILSDSGFLAPGAEELVTNADLVAGTPSAVPGESVGLLL
ncbi:MAG: ACT domain-containing protein [Euryarchaeota archaeon]|nr:ACT domain-containing protein [Euryarchaeota archaeon]MDE1836811.1 ACT domain-containing protein [Euryarchaeota archaeon]MDE1881127.1 ACT domain-containing protein [Euryarchaeota archaeon]MDE2044795.1 ACT domain-containing protein [Thermoplasmata archaeon]